MNKKDYILKLLEMLKDIRPMAWGLKILVEGNTLDDQSLDGLINIIENAIDSVDDDISKEKLKKSKEFLQKLKEAEFNSQEEDKADLDNLDKMLENI